MSEKKTILVTGGLGYIGSHTVIELFNQEYIKKQGLNEEYEVVILDNCCNCIPKIHEVLEKILNRKIPFYNVDLCDKAGMEKIFTEHKIDRVIHFAAKKSVEESEKDPLLYYKNNICGSLNLVELCRQYSVRDFIFSSTCCVYGNTNDNSNEENPDIKPENAYGRSKLYFESILKDAAKADPNFRAVMLRYCNVVGNHHSGEIGEQPTKACTNLFPIIAEHIKGLRPKVYIFGNDYPTKDGYAVRDYIHVTDIAHGHIAVMKCFQKEHENLLHDNSTVYNLGTNCGSSVKEITDAYQKVNGIKLNIEVTGRRAGDVAKICPNCEKAWKELGWKPEASLEDICRDAYNFIKKYPKGL